MTKSLRIAFLFVFTIFFVSCFPLRSQDKPEIKKSEEKVIIKGEVFYLHEVKKGHTLYSIAKAYEVTQKDIAIANPDVFDGITIGQVLKIPSKEIAKRDVNITENEDYIFHIIQKKETLYSLSKEYKVPIEDILKANPEAEYSNLQINQVIRIPKDRIEEEVEPTDSVYPYFYHRVEKKETLYSLSKEYNVDVEEIEDANEQIKLEGLKHGTIIRIPNMAYVPDEEPVDTSATEVVDSLGVTSLAGYVFSYDTCQSIKSGADTVNIAVLLPFFLDYNVSGKELKDIEKKKLNKRTSSIMDFYVGTLLALEDLKKQGLKINIRYIDTEEDSAMIVHAFKEIENDSIDFILGPVMKENVILAEKLARESKIPLVTPLVNDTNLVKNRPYLFQVNPSLDYAFYNVAEHIAKFENVHYVVMDENDSAGVSSMLVKEFVDTLQFYHHQFHGKGDSIDIEVVLYEKQETDSLMKYFSKDKRNIVVIPSRYELVHDIEMRHKEEVFVSSVMADLNVMTMHHELSVYGYPIWTWFRSIELEYFHNLDFHNITSFYIDYQDPDVIQFVRRYRDKIGTDPYKVHYLGFNYAFLGYDIMSYFATAYNQYGENLCHCVQHHNAKVFMSDYCFEKQAPGDGFVNTELFYVNYGRDVRVRIVKSPADELFDTIMTVEDEVAEIKKKEEEEKRKNEMEQDDNGR